jgi:hypothetical protein
VARIPIVKTAVSLKYTAEESRAKGAAIIIGCGKTAPGKDVAAGATHKYVKHQFDPSRLDRLY